MKREEIMAVYNAGPQAVIKLVESIILKQQEEILELKERIKALEDRLLKNSSATATSLLQLTSLQKREV